MRRRSITEPSTGPRACRQRRAIRHLAGLLCLWLALVALPGKAEANCYKDSGSAATITFQPPSTMTVSPSTPVGTVLWTSAPISPGGNQLVLDCNGGTDSGIDTAQTGSDDTLFQTNVPWLSFRILHPDASSVLHAYPNTPIRGWQITFSVASALQLVVTGPVDYTHQLSGHLGRWRAKYASSFGGGQGMHSLAKFETTNVRFISPACTVSVDPTAVTLPTVMTLNFSGVNSTAGQTPFSVQLQCSSGSNLSITLSTNSPATGVTGTGVIAPTSGSGYAQGVGVQLLDRNASPVTFDSPISVGATPSGPLSVPFYARYYQTGAISSGKVSATATYTLNYQ